LQVRRDGRDRVAAGSTEWTPWTSL